MLTKIEMEAMEAIKGIYRELARRNEPNWEQRRYELAKEIYLMRYKNTSTSCQDDAMMAVEQADILIVELRKEK